ncbi:MAG: J domain-containing protein [Mariniphaga sp.]
MQTLFGEIEESKDKVLKIKATGQKVLSKNQQLFNTLTKRIEFLEKDIVLEEKRLSRLLQVYCKKVMPFEKNIAQTRLDLAITIDKATLIHKFTKNQLSDIGETIVQLYDDAFTELEPTPEQEAIYDKWADIPLKDEVEMGMSETRDAFSTLINDLFGLGIDLDGFEPDPENFQDLEEKIRAQMEEARQTQQQQRPRKKTKKQQEKEDAEKAEEELKTKSIRSIYITLAKILHPDTETDDEKKLEKEELMKKVTVAYDQKDLTTLLKLEMEWVHKTSEHLEKLSEDKLKIYISTLKQQVIELQNERVQMAYHPRFDPIIEYVRLSENYAVNKISKDGKDLKSILDSLNEHILFFKRPEAKKSIVKFCKDYCEPEDNYDDIWGHF